MSLLVVGTIPEGTCYPPELQDLAVALAAILSGAPGSTTQRALYVQASQPTGVPAETLWFDPVNRALWIYGRVPGVTTPQWMQQTLPDASVTGDQLVAGTITSRELSADILAQLAAVAASTATSVLALPEQNGSGSYRANFFIMSDGTLRATGASKSTVNSVDRYKNGTGFVSSADASVLPKRAGFSPPLNGDTVAKVYTAKSSTFVITAAGSVYATGFNGTGQLGLGDTTDRTIFEKIDQSYFDDDPVAELAIGSGEGSYLSCYARTTTGAIYSWGHNYYGQLGLGGVTTANGNEPSTPTNIAALGTDNAQIVSAGCGTNSTSTNRVSAFVRKTDGTVYACGWNGDGQLGQGTTTASSTFVAIGSITDATLIAAAGDADHISFYAATNAGGAGDGAVMACGYNNKGQLGNGGTASQSTPVTPLTITAKLITDLQPFATGANFSVYALVDDGTLRVWGSNANKQLGLGAGAGTANQTTPATPTVEDVDANLLFVEAVRVGGSGGKISAACLTRIFSGFDPADPLYDVYTAGNNQYGNLGLGHVTEMADFTHALIDTTGIAEIAFGANHSHSTNNTTNLLIRLSNGACLACGYDAASIGQLGVDASPASISVPAFVNF